MISNSSWMTLSTGSNVAMNRGTRTVLSFPKALSPLSTQVNPQHSCMIGQSRSVVAANAVTTRKASDNLAPSSPHQGFHIVGECGRRSDGMKYQSQPLVQDHRTPRKYVASLETGVRGWFA